jgi:hypothetical protein
MTTKLSTADTTLNVFLSRPLKVEVHVWPTLKSALGGVAYASAQSYCQNHTFEEVCHSHVEVEEKEHRNLL